jgi:ribosomal protein L7/L12
MSDSWATAVAIASVAFAFTIYYVAVAWFTHRERMAKIAQGIDPDRKDQPLRRQPLSERVKQLAGDPARKIEAVKAYREETGAGLAEAKEAVESFLDGK